MNNKIILAMIICIITDVYVTRILKKDERDPKQKTIAW